MKTTNSLLILFFISAIGFSSQAQSDKKKINLIIEKYFHAIGGLEKAKQIGSFSSKSIGTLNNKPIILRKKMMLPNLFTTLMKLDGKVISKNTFDGKHGVLKQQGDEIEFTREELKRHKKNRSIFPEFDYLETAKYVGIEKVNDKDCHVLKIENSKVYYAVDSGLKRKGVSIQEKDGRLFLQELYFSNYVKIEGLLFPTNLLMTAGKQKIEFKTRSILINRGVSKKDFEITH